VNADTYSALASAIIALAALAFSIVSFNRQQVRADRQQARAEKLAMDSVKPLLWIQSQVYADLKSIRLRNHGLGPAVIKSARFEKEGHEPTNSIVKLFSQLSNVAWVTYVNLPKGRVVATQSDISLVKQTLEHLRGQGVEQKDALAILRRIQNEKKGIKVYIEYYDIFGNEMEPLEETLN
jgi:hypothetical protein